MPVDVPVLLPMHVSSHTGAEQGEPGLGEDSNFFLNGYIEHTS